MEDFHRIKRLPPYIFSITDQLKNEARARGEDIIDFGMGNPDKPTPGHIVDKLIETVQRGDTHRYSQSRGIPRLRRAICNWYKQKFDVDLDPETEAIVTLGSKEGIAHLALAILVPVIVCWCLTHPTLCIPMVSLLLMQMSNTCR